MNKQALKVKQTCPRHRRDPDSLCIPACCECRGTHLVEADVDTTGMAYMAGASTLPELIARLLTVMEHERADEAAALLARDPELVIIHAARRSGMAEVAAALQQYCWHPPAVIGQRLGRA